MFGRIENWNDGIRSMEVGLLESLKVECFWKKIGSGNGKLTREIEVGWSKEQTKLDSNTVKNEFTVAVENGFEFMGVSSSITLTTSTSQEIRNEVSSSLS